jgi:hypothetical protein
MNIKTQYSVAEEGRKAYREGKNIYANPYSYGSWHYIAWNDGYENAGGTLYNY